MKNKILAIPLILFLILMLSFLAYLFNYKGKAGELIYVGIPLSYSNMKPLFYDEQSTLFLPKKRKYLLNVWATWCLLCKAEHEFLNKLRSDGVIIIGLNYKDERQKAIDWLMHHENPYLLNLFDQGSTVDIGLIIYSVPQTFIIDQNGIILYQYSGEINSSVWDSQLKAIFDDL